ncbi:MAG TPA: hypothetical protein VMY59_08885 [Candidatus Thermoplasmatota archaeon]|nr:hypothetical protein [Candidatus Thermoplasmatota archaeon]
MTQCEYTGYTYRKRIDDAKNKLHSARHIKKSNIKSVRFNKHPVKGLWKFHAIVKSKRR